MNVMRFLSFSLSFCVSVQSATLHSHSVRSPRHIVGWTHQLQLRAVSARRTTMSAATCFQSPATLPKDNWTYFVMGGPGSGKGTQCALLANHFGFLHLSAGELLREEVKSGSATGEIIRSIIDQGNIVPAQITVDLLTKAMLSHKGPFLIDGFPRSLENYEIFESQCGPCRFILFLDVSEEVMTERLLSRSLTSGRSDDNQATIIKRISTHWAESMPVIETLRAKNIVKTVSATLAPEIVFQEVKAVFEQDLATGVAEPSKVA